MTKPLLSAVLATTCLISAPVFAQPNFSVDRVSKDIETLSSDAFEGRAPATPGETKTLEYIIQQMKAAGLEPGVPKAGDAAGWTQDVPLLKADIVGAPKLALRFGGKSQTLTQGQEIAVRAALTGQTQVDISNAPLVFVGYGVKAPERDWDDFKGVDLKGKIMVVLVNDPDFEGGEGQFGGKAMTYYGRWTYKYEEAARQGAAGVLVVHEYEPASYGWPTVQNSNTNTMFDIVRADPRTVHAPLEGWIQKDMTAALFKAAGLDFEQMKAAARTKAFKPVPLKAALDAHYAVKPETIISKNIVGRLAGKSHPNETVIYSGHWDHIGVGQPDAAGDKIYNGARDNASGIAAMIELARAFAKAPRTDRSLIFLAVTAEEKGLLGSEYYADNPVYPLASTAGVFNLDGLVGASAARDFSISGLTKLELLDLLVSEGRKLNRTYVPDPRPEAGGFYRSDHFPMAKRGVPAVSFNTGRDLLNGGTARGKAEADLYVKERYHQPADEWSADWDMSSVVPDLTLLYNAGRALANSRSWPQWSADSEFRAERDKTAAQRK